MFYSGQAKNELQEKAKNNPNFTMLVKGEDWDATQFGQAFLTYDHYFLCIYGLNFFVAQNQGIACQGATQQVWFDPFDHSVNRGLNFFSECKKWIATATQNWLFCFAIFGE